MLKDAYQLLSQTSGLANAHMNRVNRLFCYIGSKGGTGDVSLKL